jgi:hypothetical protein
MGDQRKAQSSFSPARLPAPLRLLYDRRRKAAPEMK